MLEIQTVSRLKGEEVKKKNKNKKAKEQKEQTVTDITDCAYMSDKQA